MTHDEALPHLTELAAGRLSEPLAAAVRAHAEGCEDCGRVLEAARAIQAEVQEHGAALFSEHPAPDDLSRWAIAPRELATTALANVGGHVRACPTCAHEAALARAAAASAWQRALPSWLAVAGERGAWLKPALAVLALLLVWPAYQGLIELPRTRAALERSMSPVAPAPIAPAPAAPWSGAAKTLVLAGASRAVGDVAEIVPEPGQPLVPVLLDVDLSAHAPGESLVVIVKRRDGPEVWQHRATVGAGWDAAARVASLLVPTTAMPPAEYVLELRVPSGTPIFSARFRVAFPSRR